MELIFRLLVFSACFLLCAWANKAPDLTKLKSFDSGEQVKWGINPPFVVKYSAGDSSLFYIAASHTNEPKSNTFTLIKEAIALQKPQVIILEGFEYSNGVSPDYIIASANQYCVTNVSPKCNEILYTANYAKSLGIPFVGAEPDDRDMMRLMKDLGYNELDIFGYAFTVSIAGMYEQNIIASLDDLEKEFRKNRRYYDMLTQNITYDQYYKWLSEKLGKPITLNVLVDRYYITSPDFSGNFFQKMSYNEIRIRDQNIINIINSMTQKYNRVLVLFGGGHYLTQRYVLNDLYGEPKILELKCELKDK